MSTPSSSATFHVPEADGILVLDSLQPALEANMPVTIEAHGPDGPLIATTVYTTLPRIEESLRATVTTLEIEGDTLPQNSRGTVHFDMVPAGRVAVLPKSSVGPGDFAAGLRVSGEIALPSSMDSTDALRKEFIIEDGRGQGYLVDGVLQVDRANRVATFHIPNPAQRPSEALALPVIIYGNVVHFTEGKTVEAEVLAEGDDLQDTRTVTLKKKPLIYLPPEDGEIELRSTLEVYVDGRRWEEVSSFYRRGPMERVYVVQTLDDGTANITFGDGRFGARLPAGSRRVVARYRHGAGAPAAEPGTVVVSKPPPELRRIHQPIAGHPGQAFDAGDDPVVTRQRALLLDRAISVPDFQAFAATLPGVARASAETRWLSGPRARGVQIWLVGDADPSQIRATLAARAAEDVTIEVSRATAVRAELSIDLELSLERPAADIETDIRRRLFDEALGALSLSRIPIGAPLTTSRLLAPIHAVSGVLAVTALRWAREGSAFEAVSDRIAVAAGHYLFFDGPEAVSLQVTRRTPMRAEPRI